VGMSSYEALIEVIRVLQMHEIPYMLVGAFSSNAYGYPRATKDADIVMEYRQGVLTKIVASLGADFQLDPQCGHTNRRRCRHPKATLAAR
jgi:hypothetical protein